MRNGAGNPVYAVARLIVTALIAAGWAAGASVGRRNTHASQQAATPTPGDPHSSARSATGPGRRCPAGCRRSPRRAAGGGVWTQDLRTLLALAVTAAVFVPLTVAAFLTAS